MALRMLLSSVVALLLAVSQVATPSAGGSPQRAEPEAGARNPAYARDGRLALAVRGDLWIRTRTDAPAPARWTRVVTGAGWDREPAWTADGSALVYSSDRGGTFALWRVAVGPDGATAEPVRVTAGSEPEGEPSLSPDGTVVFVRGRGATARLWARSPAGIERRLTRGDAAERWPAVSADGQRVAYVVSTEGAARLRVRMLGDSARASDSLIVSDRAAERPDWSPDGSQIAFATRGARPGVWVTSVDGQYVNMIASRSAEPAWSPDGRSLALAELPPDEPGYNGDPDRVGDRDRGEALSGGGRLWTIDAPPPPNTGLQSQFVATTVGDRARYNAEIFDRVLARTATLYFSASDAAIRRRDWEALGARFRPRALAALTDSALRSVIHEMHSLRPPLRTAASGRSAVSSAHPVATAAGLEILRRGGNVVDAAVAVSFALGVVEPDASGIGGYGQMVLSLRTMAKPALIEFMSRVPEEATLANGTLAPGGTAPVDGPVLANVPGTVAALHLAWRKYGSGKVPWADLLAPAIRAARDGYIVSDGLATTLDRERAHFLKYDAARALFFRDGRPLRTGDTLRNTDLAWVMEQIASGGADAFYRGEVARRIVTDLRGKGNAMRATDLARYYAAEREPVAGTYRGYTLYSSAPPSAGGASLIGTLNLLERAGTMRPYPDDAATLHAMLGAWQLVPSTRGRIADPGLWPTTVEPFQNKDTAAVRWRCFDPARVLPSTAFRGDTLVCGESRAPAVPVPDAEGRGASASSATEADLHLCDETHGDGNAFCHASGTTAFTVADAEGNMVSVTQTLGTWGGNFYVTPGLGFLYNDKLTSYGSDPSGYGARLGNARHGSTMAPTIVFRGEGATRRPVLAVGAAGNQWITSAVYQTLVGVLDFGLGAQRALELPRFHVGQRTIGGRRETVVDHEDGLAPAVVQRLRALGYVTNAISLQGELRMGYGAAITWDGRRVTAGADPRRAGEAGAIP